MVLEQSAPSDPLLGKIIKDYRFIKVLGTGGFGAVYLAQYLHPTLRNQYVAAKFIDIRDQRGAEDVEREIRIMQEMQHPYIVKIRDTFVFDNVPPNETGHHPRFIMMDFVRGGSLQGLLARLNNRLLSYQVILAAANQIATALSYVHRRNILHLDLKPANILLEPVSESEPPHFMLTDFGIAQFTRPDSQLSRWGGTPSYMSPEHFGLIMDVENKRVAAPDHRSDIYGLGVILYQLVVGQVPFQGHMHELAQQHRYAPVPPPSDLVQGVPRDLELIILRALQKQPADRYQSVDELRQALSDINLDGADSARERISDREVGKFVESISTPVDDILNFEAAYQPAAAAAVGAGFNFTLLVIDHEGAETEHSFASTPIVIGRSRQADLVLESRWVSGRHARLDYQGGQLRVTDLGSRNGTFLDGQALAAEQPAAISPNQWLNLGDYSLQVVHVHAGDTLPQPVTPPPASAPPAQLSDYFNSYSISQAAPPDIPLDRVVSQLKAQIEAPRIHLRVTPEIVPVQVGRTEFVTVHITPQHVPAESRYRLHVAPGPGVDPAWYALAQPRIIRPGETAAFDMTLTIPPDVRQGDYQLSLGVIADHREIPEAVQVVQLQVRRHVDFTVSLNPNQVNHRWLLPSVSRLTITNRGNDREIFQVEVEAPETLRVTLPVTQFTIEPAQKQTFPLKLRGSGGQVAYMPFRVSVSVPGQPPIPVHGTYIRLNRPPLPVRLLRTLLIVIVLASVVAIIDQLVLDARLMLLLRDLITSLIPDATF